MCMKITLKSIKNALKFDHRKKEENKAIAGN